jgi:hypothetical protein
MSDDDALSMWTIYDHPKDFPNHYVARLYQVDKQGPRASATVVAAETLEALRRPLRNIGLTRLPRDPSDDPVIIETWV